MTCYFPQQWSILLSLHHGPTYMAAVDKQCDLGPCGNQHSNKYQTLHKYQSCSLLWWWRLRDSRNKLPPFAYSCTGGAAERDLFSLLELQEVFPLGKRCSQHNSHKQDARGKKSPVTVRIIPLLPFHPV